jgi:CHAT domain-containing protein/Tfp pilus assembly protein PilF
MIEAIFVVISTSNTNIFSGPGMLNKFKFVILIGCCALSLGIHSIATAQDANTLKEKGRALYKQGNYAAAAATFEQAVTAATATLGANAQPTDIIVNELAMSYYQLGNLSEAAKNYRRVLQNTEARSGKQNSEVATCLNNLAAVFDDAGDFAQAESLYQRSYQIQVAAYGPNSSELATTLNNLGSVFAGQGDDTRAIEMYRQALAASQKKVPKDDKLTALIIHNMANSQSGLGQFDDALKLFQQALTLRTAAVGPDHPSVATTLNSMAYPLKAQKKFDEAERVYRQALSQREKRLGPDHPAVATSLNNIAWLNYDQGRYAEAEKWHQQALKIREAKLGPDHPDVASSLHSLATTLRELNQDDKAEEHWLRSLKIRQAKLGAAHPLLAETLGQLGVLHAKQQKFAAAVADFDQVRRIARQHIGSILPEMTEAEQLTYLKQTDEKALHTALSLALLCKDDLQAVEKGAEWLLNAKGIAQQALAQRAINERDQKDPALAAISKQLQLVRRELIMLLRTAPAPTGDEKRLKQIAELRQQEATATAQLAAATGRPILDARWVELSEVRKKLADGALLIDIARIRLRHFNAKTHDERWQPEHYIVWLIPAAGKETVKLIDLGPAEEVDAVIRKVREALVKSKDSIVANGERAAEQELQPILASLAKLVLAPLLPHLATAKKLHLSPDSSLWLVPWSALPVGEASYAIEKFELSYAVSGRDLLAANAAGSNGLPLIYADPDYNLGVEASLKSLRTIYRGSLPLTRSVRSKVGLGRVERLPGTAIEAQLITPKLEEFAGTKPQVYLGEFALEGALKGSARPKILVVSTHGFFQAAAPAKIAEDDSGLSRQRAQYENPLLHCGLLMSGCNVKALATRTDADDGVLTGLEIGGIDLRGTELVVLSACETGLGEIQNGEGVAGLRQAFQISGARNVISTLWQIPDRDSAMIVDGFFSKLASGQTKSEALRSSQLKRIEARRARNGAAHPFFWAAWTITGE